MNSSRILALICLLACALLAFARTIGTDSVISTTDTLTYEYPWRGVIKPTAELEKYAQSDVTCCWHPWKIFYHREFQRGHYPFWSPDIACGYPVFADSTMMGYSLPIFLQSFLPSNLAINLGFFLQTCIGMIGLFWLLQTWRLSSSASLFGAMAFGLSFPVLEWEVAVSVSGAIIMLPYLVLALDKYRSTQAIRYLAWASLVCGLGILQGSIQSMLYLYLAALAIACAHCWEQPSFFSSCGKWILSLAVLTVLSFCLAAIALIPALQFFLFHNIRTRGIVDNWPAFLFLRPLVLTPLTVLGTINPALLGNSHSIDFRPIVTAIFGNMGFEANWGSNQWCAYIGIAPLTLAFVAWMRRKADPHVRLALWLVFLPAGLMLWTPLYMITYTRGHGITSLGLAILAALGFEYLRQQPTIISKRLKYVHFAFCFLLVIGMCVVSFQSSKLLEIALSHMKKQQALGHQSMYLASDYEFQVAKIRAFIDNYSLHSPNLWSLILICLATGFILKALENKWLSVKAILLLFLALTAVDLALLCWRTVPVVPVATVYPPVPALSFLQKQPGLFRVNSDRILDKEIEIARPNQLLPYDIQTNGISESVVPSWTHNAAGEFLPDEYSNVRYLILPPQSALPVDPQRATPVYEGPDAKIYLYRHTLPRAFLWPLEPGETAQQARRRLEQSSPQEILSNHPGNVDIFYDNTEHLRLTFSTTQPALLIVLDRTYPGWNAMAQGIARPIEPVFGIMRSFEVQAGESQAQMVFQPTSWRAGCCISFLAATTLLGLILCRRRSTTV